MFEITVKWNDKKAYYELEPTSSVGSLKSKIQQDFKIPIKDQKLLKGGKPLSKDDMLLSDEDVEDGDTLHVLANYKEVKYQIDNGAISSEKLFASVTIDEFLGNLLSKSQISTIGSYSASLEGSELLGSRSLEELQLSKEKIIHISNEPFITATVEDENHNPCDYRIRSSDTIFTLMKLINKGMQIPVEEQALIYKTERLDSKRTFASYEIKDDFCVMLKKKIILSLMLKYSGNTKQINFDHSEKLKSLKECARMQFGLDEGFVTLSLLDRKRLENDNRFLFEFNIDSATEIEVRREMKLHIKLTNKEFVVWVPPDATVRKLKEIIYEEQKIPENKQQIIHQGKTLEDNCVLVDVDIQSETSLHLSEASDLEKEQIEFVVEVAGREQKLTIKFSKNETIKTFKKKIQEESENKYMAEDQELWYSGTVLDDERTIDSYGLSQQSKINLTFKMKFTVYIKNCEGRCERIDFKSSMIVKNLKFKIKEKFEIDLPDQILLHAGRVLDQEEKTLFEYGVQNETAITLIKKVIPENGPNNGLSLFVVDNSRNLKLMIKVTGNETIKTLKEKVQAKIGDSYLIEYQELWYNNTKLDDEGIIDSYGLAHQSTVNLKFKMKFTVDIKNYEGICKRVDIDPYTPVKMLKLKIKDNFEIDPPDQILWHDGRVLDEEEKTLFEYGIQSESTITLIKTHVRVRVHTMDMETTLLEISPDNDKKKMYDLKKEISKKLSIPIEHQRLIYNGVLLKDDASCGILNHVEKDTIDIYLIQTKEAPYIFWKNSSNIAFIRRVKKSSTVDELGELVKTDAGIKIKDAGLESIIEDAFAIRLDHLNREGGTWITACNTRAAF